MAEQYYNIVREELEKFIRKYQKNPFDFLTEYDLQSYLYSKIFDHFEKEKIELEIETTGIKEPIKNFKKDGSLKIKVNPVKTEYPVDYRFDIAIIDNNELQPKASAYWHQKLKIAIEIKYHRCSFNRIPSETKKFKADIEKLKNYQTDEEPKNFRGLSILFIQNDNQEKEEEFSNKTFKEGYEKINIDSVLSEDGINGLIVTGSSMYLLKIR
jgi:hypothetical protein